MGDWINKYHTVYNDYSELSTTGVADNITDITVATLMCSFWNLPKSCVKTLALDQSCTCFHQLLESNRIVSHLRQHSEDEIRAVIQAIARELDVVDSIGDCYRCWAGLILSEFFTLEDIISVAPDLEAKPYDEYLILATIILMLKQNSILHLNLSGEDLVRFVKSISVDEREDLLTRLRNTSAFIDCSCFNVHAYYLLIEDTKYDYIK